jgi:hypothetical protein
MQEGLSAPVVGPSTIFPRGFIWLAVIWYGAALAALALSPWPPMWFRAAAAAGLLAALLIFLAVLSTVSVHAFFADQNGVRIGLPASTRRRGRRRREAKHLPWRHIERIRISSRPLGVQLDFVLGEQAGLSARGMRRGPLGRAWRWLLLFIPFWYTRRAPGVTTPLAGPPRYRVIVRGATVDELRLALRGLAPPDVAVAVLVRKG